MKIHLSASAISIITCVVCFMSGEVIAQAQKRIENPTEMIEKLANQYSTYKTSQEKRQFSLGLIDNGVISRGKPIAVLAKIFGRDAFLATGEWSFAASVLVHFSPQHSSNSKLEAVPFVGWYLKATSDAGGNIIDYSLSNLHK